jgi:hypothetical protein
MNNSIMPYLETVIYKNKLNIEQIKTQHPKHLTWFIWLFFHPSAYKLVFFGIYFSLILIPLVFGLIYRNNIFIFILCSIIMGYFGYQYYKIIKYTSKNYTLYEHFKNIYGG